MEGIKIRVIPSKGGYRVVPLTKKGWHVEFEGSNDVVKPEAPVRIRAVSFKEGRRVPSEWRTITYENAMQMAFVRGV